MEGLVSSFVIKKASEAIGLNENDNTKNNKKEKEGGSLYHILFKGGQNNMFNITYIYK